MHCCHLNLSLNLPTWVAATQRFIPLGSCFSTPSFSFTGCTRGKLLYKAQKHLVYFAWGALGHGQSIETSTHRETSTTWTEPFLADLLQTSYPRLANLKTFAARLVNQRGTTLSDLTKKRRRAGSGECQSKLCPSPQICRKSHVVYLATCDLCGNRYVGMTVRQLHARALEHVRAATQHQEHTAFGDHYRTRH